MLDRDLMSNLYSHDSMLNTLINTKENSFEYLYNLQKSITNIHRFDFTMKDFELVSDNVSFTRRYVLNVPKDIIPTATRSKYKKSPFFNKVLSIKDISQNYDTFPNNLLIFIEGAVYTNIKVKPNEDFTHLIIEINNGVTIKEGFEKETVYDLLERNVPITVFILPNSLYGEFNTNKHVIRKFNGQLDMKYFSIYGDKKEDITKSLILINDTENLHKKYVIPERVEQDKIMIDRGFVGSVDTRYSQIHLFNIQATETVKKIVPGETFFQLPMKDTPIPVEFMMPFFKDGDKLIFAHNTKVKYHYPDIYELDQAYDKEVRLLIPYKQRILPQDSPPQFMNELFLYYWIYEKEMLNQYKNGTVPDYIKNYKPRDYLLSIKDLQAKGYDNKALIYKILKMDEFIDKDNNILSKYLHRFIKEKPTLKIRTKEIDLSTRLRLNTYTELGTLIPFDEPMYVFSFTKYFVDEFDLRFFIDGKFFRHEHIYSDDNYYYVYLPVSIITNDTFIFIEKSKEFVWNTTLTFDTTVKTIELPMSDAMINDLFIVDRTTGYYLDMTKFSILTNNQEISTDKHIELGTKFSIKLLDAGFKNVPLELIIRKDNFFFHSTVETESQRYKAIQFNANIQRDIRNVRIFRNGRLVPPEYYVVNFKSNTSRYSIININMIKELHDVINVDIGQIKFEQVFYQKLVDMDKIVDVGEKLAKPLDFKWYDFYMNGFRLADDNIEFITPTKMIIKNIRTNKNLTILQKNCDHDVFQLRNANSPNDNIIDLFPEVSDKIEETIPPFDLDDSIKDIITEVIEGDDLSYWVEDTIRYLFNINPFINPDVKYETDHYELEPAFPNGVLFIDTDNMVKYAIPILLNPDDEMIDPDFLPTGEDDIFPDA